MDDFLELGMEGVDKVVDKNFHKVPDKYLHSDAYIPHRRHKRDSTRSSTQDPSEDAYYEAKAQRKSSKDQKPKMANQDVATGGTYLDYNQNPNYNHNPVPNYGSAEMANVPVYSNVPPHPRPQYTPYYPSNEPPRQYESYRPDFDDRRSRRGRRDSSSSSSGYDSDRPVRRPVRPKNLQRRRSSSYHGPSSRGNDLALARRSGSSHTGVRDQVKDKAHRYGVKGEIDDLFTSSKKGLTGAAVGALVGGWAAHKAQEANKRGNGSSNNLITLLGAAAGGIIADVGVSKWETANSKTEEKEEKWEKKFGSEGGRSRRGSRDRGTRRRRDSYSSDEGRYRR
ncbi:hypothetical protein GLAREA_01601 [Glarea lozoyensis ATCC 20868]|uniref:Glycine zipper 2TM domain-containing protein n=1 Tax=Glarea lozoyensis (strain ATCC 20868 / MF5171) TaxID=1116229 RepID=S3CKF1_GLAL2|nr:uncharacterized protein GLAREA_01601 [Glarea lozoyensis ATCC 20868]EPE25689.1 hypothetical protein GLAREA_01601 [Glarea lozoyensis ATCC 20868]